MVIATGLVERQIDAMATHLVDALEEKAGLSLSRDRIQSSPDWVLIDAGDVVIHLFRPEARVTYGLERMWGPGSPHGEGTVTADHAPLPEGAPTGEPLAEDEIGGDDDPILGDEDEAAAEEEEGLLLGDDEDDDEDEEEDHGPT